MPETATRAAMENLDLDCISFEQEQAVLTGLLRKSSQEFGLSLADRACLVLTEQQQCEVLTADSVWADIPLFQEKVRLIG